MNRSRIGRVVSGTIAVVLFGTRESWRLAVRARDESLRRDLKEKLDDIIEMLAPTRARSRYLALRCR